MDKTRVVFRIINGEVIALLPELPGDSDPATCLSYMHVGQHGAASIYHKWPIASEKEYRDLYEELTSIGYDLQVCKRVSHKMHLNRLAAINPSSAENTLEKAEKNRLGDMTDHEDDR